MTEPNLISGVRPSLTAAQLAALVVAGIPILSTLLSAFGLFEVSPEQQAALGDAVTWGGVTAGALIAGDAGLRGARNVAAAKTDAAAMYASSEGGVDPDPAPLVDDEVDGITDADLPTDADEQLPPPTPEHLEPGEPAVVQPSQVGEADREDPEAGGPH